MKPTPDFVFWLHLLAWLAGETALAIALAAVAAWFLRSPAWRRTLWQAAFVALALVLVAELTGLGRSLVWRMAPQPKPARHFVVRGNLPVTAALGQPTTPASAPVDAGDSAALDAATPATPASHWWPGWLWLAGSGVLLLRFAAARLLLLATGWRRRAVVEERLRQQAEAIRRRLGLRRRVRLLEFSGLRSPIAFGVLRPAIGLPARFGEAFPLEQREAMLAHELAHLAARDPFWHGVAELVTAALWWLPPVWWARRQLHAASESAADEASLVVDHGPVVLAECLVDLGKRLDRRQALVWLGVEGGGYRSGLGRRVQRLLELDGAAWRPVTWTTKLVLLVSPCVVAALTVAVAAWAAPRGDAEPSLVAVVEEALASTGAPDASAPAASPNAEPKQKTVPGTNASGIAFEVRPSVREPGHILLVGPDRELRLDSKPTSLDELEAGLARAKGTNADLNVLLLFRGEEGLKARLQELRPVLDRAGVTYSIITGAPEWLYQSATNAPAGTNSAVQSNRLHAATLTQDGKLLYEMGKLDEAETKLRQAIKEDPDNHSAAYYLNRIAEARPGDPSATNPAPFFRRVIPTNQGRQAIMSKLNRLRLPEVKFDGMELGEVLRSLSMEVRRLDPDKAGINLLLMPVASPPASAPTIDPNTGLPVAAPPRGMPTDASTVRININQPLHAIRLADVLDAIVRTAEKPIQYAVEDYAVIFSAKATESVPLYTRQFKVDPNTFLEGLRKALSSPSVPLPRSKPGTELSPAVAAALQQDLRDFFTANGLDFSPAFGKSVFFNDRQGTLLVRATAQDLDKIEAKLGPLMTPPPQVNIQVRYAGFSVSDDRALGFDWFLGNVLMGERKAGVQGGTAPTQGGIVFPAGPTPISIPSTNANGVVGTLTGILTDAQFSNVIAVLDSAVDGTVRELRGNQLDWPGRAVTNAQNIRVTAFRGPNLIRVLTSTQSGVALHALEQRAGAEVLMPPEITTLNGRAAQVRAIDLHSVLTGINPEAIVRPRTKAKDAPKVPPLSSVILECGPVLDVAPSVLPDGQTVNLALTASVTEFLGYDPPQRGDQVRVWQDGRRKLVARPAPHVRFRQMQAHGRVYDGQTLVVVGPVVEQKRLLLFVTPTIVDPAGNRVHSDAQLPSRGNAVPPQK